MLSFSLVTEALMGLIYHRPSGENFSFEAVQRNCFKHRIQFLCPVGTHTPLFSFGKATWKIRTICETVKTRNLRLLQPTWSWFSVGIKDELVKGSQNTFRCAEQSQCRICQDIGWACITNEGWKKWENNLRRPTGGTVDYKKLKKDTLSCLSMGEWLRGIVD